MFVISLLNVFVVLFILFFNKSSAQTPNIPCPHIFQYASDGDTNYGIITLSTSYFGEKETEVVIVLTQSTPYTSNYAGSIGLNFNKDEVFDYINKGQPIKYRVDFSAPNIWPMVKKVSVNGVDICSGPGDTSRLATITLKHVLVIEGNRPKPEFTSTKDASSPQSVPNFLNFAHSSHRTQPSFMMRYSEPTFIKRNSEPPASSGSAVLSSGNPFLASRTLFSNMPRMTPVTQAPWTPPLFQQRLDTQTTTVRPENIFPPNMPMSPNGMRKEQSPWAYEYLNRVCGKENEVGKINRLAVNGEVIAKSRFPWIVAIFIRTKLTNTFKCGGNLISSRTIISAAHCFMRGFERIPSESMFLSLGRHNLNDWDNALNIDIRQVIIHPEFKQELVNFDADLAIVLLQQSVSFTPAIRPICLWQGSNEVRHIEGFNGIVVGWGEDETHNGSSSIPKLVNATVVSDLTCIRSNSKLLELTSERTICAGNRDGSGPCVGDSGSGLMIRKQNRWMLRGIVSAALGTPTINCKLDEYVVYADVAKFMEWIEANMFL